MVTPKTGWLSNGAFLSLSSMCREFIEFFYSHSTRYFPCCFSKTAPVCRCHRSWVYLKATSFFCGLPSRLKRPGRKLDDSVSVVLLCHHDRDVHPLCLLLRCVVVATGERDPQNCIDAHPYEQLLTPAAVAGFHALRDRPSATAGAIVTAARRAMTFTCVLYATVVPPAIPFSPRSESSGDGSSSRPSAVALRR